MYKHAISLTLVLSAIWLLLSGMWTHPVIVPLGVLSVAFAVYLTCRLGILDSEGVPFHLFRRSLRYWPWLLVSIVKANVGVALRILSPDMRLSPRIARLRVSQTSALGRTVLANSITLNPGSVSIDVNDEEILFYALTEELAEELLSGDMDVRVSRFAGEDAGR